MQIIQSVGDLVEDLRGIKINEGKSDKKTRQLSSEKG